MSVVDVQAAGSKVTQSREAEQRVHLLAVGLGRGAHLLRHLQTMGEVLGSALDAPGQDAVQLGAQLLAEVRVALGFGDRDLEGHQQDPPLDGEVGALDVRLVVGAT